MRKTGAGDAPAYRHAQPTEPAPGRVARVSFRQGLIINLLNPKVAAFFLSLFPRFALPGLTTTAVHTVLAGIFWASPECRA